MVSSVLECPRVSVCVCVCVCDLGLCDLVVCDLVLCDLDGVECPRVSSSQACPIYSLAGLSDILEAPKVGAELYQCLDCPQEGMGQS